MDHRDIDDSPQLPPYVCLPDGKLIIAGALTMLRDIIRLYLLAFGAAKILLCEPAFQLEHHIQQ